MDFVTLRSKIVQKFEIKKHWQPTADDFKISRGLAYRIAVEGYEPKDPHIRAALELPVLVPAPVCPKCGEVHVTKKCTKNKPAKRRPRIDPAWGEGWTRWEQWRVLNEA